MTPVGRACLQRKGLSIKVIAIIDYGMGNIHSVQKALESSGAKTLVTNKAADIRECDKVVLPGVGAFADAMQELKKQDLVKALSEHIGQKKAFLGICLGMQLLFDSSQEARGTEGLGFVSGTVERLQNKNRFKVPHMGWNSLKVQRQDCLLLKGLADNAFVYFCHSYYPEARDKKVVAATTDYGIDFASVIWKDNIYGVQFHPEKSQKSGLKMLDNFVNLC